MGRALSKKGLFDLPLGRAPGGVYLGQEILLKGEPLFLETSRIGVGKVVGYHLLTPLQQNGALQCLHVTESCMWVQTLTETETYVLHGFFLLSSGKYAIAMPDISHRKPC
jgi:hypothetical protein